MPPHRLDVAECYGGVDAVMRQLGMPLGNPCCRGTVAIVPGPLEDDSRQLVETHRRERAIDKCLLKDGPVRVTMFPRQRVLNLAKRRRLRRVRPSQTHALGCSRVALPERFQPALCVLLEWIEIGPRAEDLGHKPPFRSRLVSAGIRPEEGCYVSRSQLGGSEPPCRGQVTPQCALRGSCRR